MITLRLPLRDIFVTQPFGVNYFDFYQKMGLPYHPGVDFRARHGFECYAANGGEVIGAGVYSDGGIGIEIRHPEGWSTFYYHLLAMYKEVGDKVIAGSLIGVCDNTGKYTTADHLHFELRIPNAESSGEYSMAIGSKVNPAGFFNAAYDGTEIGPKDWDKSRCYHRYYRGRPKGGYQNELKILAILGKKGIWPTCEKINALVYGGWDLPTVINPAMYEIYSQLKKDEFLNKHLRPFQ